MAGRVLSIEIGYSLTRVCEVDFKTKTPKVYKSFTVPTVEGVMDDGVITMDSHYAEGLRGGLREHGIKAKQIVFSIASTKIATREVVIPYVKENRIANVVQANAAEYFPVDLSQYQLAYSVLDTIGDKKEGQKYKLLVLAMPASTLKGYYELAAALKMEVAAFDYAGNSLYHVMKNECEVGTNLIAKIDERSTLIMVIKEQQIVFTRNVAYGVEDALQAVMNSQAWGKILTMRQALQTIEKYHCIDLMANDEETFGQLAASAEEKAQRNVTDALQPMLTGIARVIDFYSSRGDNSPIDQVYVTGVGANFLGMDRLLNKEINLPVEPVKRLEGMNLERHFKGGFFGEYLACIGAAISPLGFLAEEEKKKGSMDVLPDKKNMLGLSILVCVAGVVVAGALAGISIMDYMSATDEQTRMKNRIAELEQVETMYQQYLQAKYTNDKMNFFQDSTVTPNESLVEFMEEMEEKMPTSLNVQSFIADLNSVTMSLTVENMDDAAKLIQQLRSFETIGDVTVASVTDTGALMDGEVIETEPYVQLTVVAAYKGEEELAADAAQAAEEAAQAEAQTEEE